VAGPSHRQQSKMIVASLFCFFLDSNGQCTIVGIKEGGKKENEMTNG
jgi:hypothetical protein